MRSEDLIARSAEPAQAAAGQPGDTLASQDIARVLGMAVRRFRRRREWSLQALAERAGLCYQFVSEVETGKRNFSIVTMAKLAEALGVSVVALIVEAYGPTA